MLDALNTTLASNVANFLSSPLAVRSKSGLDMMNVNLVWATEIINGMAISIELIPSLGEFKGSQKDRRSELRAVGISGRSQRSRQECWFWLG